MYVQLLLLCCTTITTVYVQLLLLCFTLSKNKQELQKVLKLPIEIFWNLEVRNFK